MIRYSLILLFGLVLSVLNVGLTAQARADIYIERAGGTLLRLTKVNFKGWLTISTCTGLDYGCKPLSPHKFRLRALHAAIDAIRNPWLETMHQLAIRNSDGILTTANFVELEKRHPNVGGDIQLLSRLCEIIHRIYEQGAAPEGFKPGKYAVAYDSLWTDFPKELAAALKRRAKQIETK